jgi:hypothetical protein
MTVQSSERVLPPVVRWGRRLLLTSVVFLIVGGATVKMVPGLQGRGLDNVVLSILIPIWAIGIAGILSLLIGWIRHPMLHTDLDADCLGLELRPDGKIFGPFTKSLAVLTVTLLWLGSFGLFVDSGDPNPLWAKGLLFYCITCYCGLVVYLVVLYRAASHHATTTYLHLLMPLFAFILIPLTWPLLIALNWVVFKHDRDDADRAEWNELTDDRFPGP